MKNVLRLLTQSALVATFALAVSAQTTQPATTTPATPAAQDDKAKCAELYNTWRENRNGDAAAQKKAYESGKTYLSTCPNDEYVSYVQKWVPKYEAAVRTLENDKQFRDAIAAKNWKQVIAAGKQITAADQENLGVFVTMAYAGTENLRMNAADESLNADATAAARRALQLVEAGKADAFTAEQWKNVGFPNKNELVSWLNSTLGFFNFKKSPGEAANFYVKALQTDGALKKDAGAYHTLALAYQNAEYVPMASDYQANCAGKDLTDECKVKFDKMKLVVDRIIDALARAVSLADASPTAKPKKADWMKLLEEFYKFRNDGQTTGLTELVANIQSKPLLLPSMQTMPTPTPTPAPATTTTPAGGTASTTTATPTPATGNAAAPATNTTKPAATTNSTTKPATKPADPNPPKPKS